MTVQVTGARGVVASLDKFYFKCREAIEKEVDHSLDNIASNARARVPKKSGELLSTIRKEKRSGELFGYVMAGYGKIRRRAGSKAGKNHSKDQDSKGIYAPVVEFGSKDPKNTRKARPFLFPAWRIEKTPFDNRLRQVIADAAARAMSGNSSAVSS